MMKQRRDSYNWFKTFMDSDKSLSNIKIVQSKHEQRIEKIEIWQNAIRAKVKL